MPSPSLCGPPGTPLGLRVVVSYRCNNRCRFCYQRHRAGEQLTAARLRESLLKLGGDFAPAYATLMGGEPTLSPHLLDIVGELRRRYPAAALRMTTNGTAPFEQYRTLAEHGLGQMTFSLQTLDPGRYRQISGQSHTELAAICDRIIAMRDTGVEVRINAFILPREVEAVYRFCKEHRLSLTFCEELRDGVESTARALRAPAGATLRDENALRRVFVDADGFEFWNYKQLERFDYNNWIVLPDGTLTDDFADILAQRGTGGGDAGHLETPGSS